MSEHISLLFKKLDHLTKMREYLRYSVLQTKSIIPIQNWQNLQPSEHEYEENTDVLSEFFQQLVQTTPTFFQWHEQLHAFCLVLMSPRKNPRIPQLDDHSRCAAFVSLILYTVAHTVSLRT